MASARWGKKKNSNRGRFGSQGRNYAQKSRKEDIETSEIKPSRYVTPQKKKRDESVSTSNQTTSSEKVAPPRKRVNKERTNVQKVATQKNVSLTLSHSERESVHALLESLKRRTSEDLRSWKRRMLVDIINQPFDINGKDLLTLNDKTYINDSCINAYLTHLLRKIHESRMLRGKFSVGMFRTHFYSSLYVEGNKYTPGMVERYTYVSKCITKSTKRLPPRVI